MLVARSAALRMMHTRKNSIVVVKSSSVALYFGSLFS